jgi:hypothetical protein
MNYFLSNLFRDKVMWIILGLAALAGMMIMDLLTFMLTPRAVFGMWTFKITIGAAVVGTLVFGLFLRQREKKDRRLHALLPGFLEERLGFLKNRVSADADFQTLCHQCRHFDLSRLRCLLVLRERKAWVKLNDDSPIRHCLYWNLEDRHPVLLLTGRIKIGSEGDRFTADGVRCTEETGQSKK